MTTPIVRIPRVVTALADLAALEPSLVNPDVMVLGDDGGLFSLEAGTTDIDGATRIASIKSGYLWQKHQPVDGPDATTQAYVDGKASDYDSAGTASGVMTWHETNWDHDTFAVIPRKSTAWVPARAMTARTTNGAAVGTVETTTNKVMLATLDFDKDADEFAQFTVAMPKSWNGGTVTFIPFWTAAAGSASETVVWSMQARGFVDDDALDQAFGTAVDVSDALIAANDIHVGAESAAITLAGTLTDPALAVFQIYRDVSADNLAGDAGLVGVKLLFTEDAYTDE